MLFCLIAGAVFLFSLSVRQNLMATYRRWSQVRSATREPGGRVARIILDSNDLRRVPVEAVAGTLTDHYDLRHDLRGGGGVLGLVPVVSGRDRRAGLRG